ncbi:hypothetical protein [Dactylosporangium sp. NPDC051541]|uniref:hypothetical protein n=1 Tax=Dactylosporangium sp. NPDC051541 TaxID=3363977 RepID=UPI00378869A0
MRRSTSVPLGRSYLALAALATTGGLAACSRQQQTYCADQNGVVVPDARCDDGSPGHYYYTGSYGRGRSPGYRLSGGSRVSSTDSVGRSNAGLPSTGHVANGSTHSGGFGSSSKGSSGS